jgi:hypothetical protein
MAELQRAKVGATVKGLQAIKRAGGDISRALPLLGERSGMSPEEIAALGNVLQSDANALDGLASMFGSSNKKYGGNIVYGVDNTTGKLVAYQPGIDGAEARSGLPEGITPIDPLKFVDVGDRQVGVGTRSGAPLRILPKGQTPDNRANNQTRITVAGMRPTAGTGGKPAADPAAVARGAQPVVTALKDAVNRL